MLATLPCTNCYELNLELYENSNERKGLASCLVIFCTSCNWDNERCNCVAHFKIGANATIKVLKKMGIKPGLFCEQLCNDEDRLWVKLANYKEDDKSKRRKVLKRKYDT